MLLGDTGTGQRHMLFRQMAHLRFMITMFKHLCNTCKNGKPVPRIRTAEFKLHAGACKLFSHKQVCVHRNL